MARFRAALIFGGFISLSSFGCSNDSQTNDPNHVVALLTMQLHDTAIIASAGDRVPCFDTKEHVAAYEDADAKGDDPQKNRALRYAFPLKSGEEVKAVDNGTGVVKLEVVPLQKDCWEDANAEIVKRVHHTDD